jgi:hypothetical protein
MSLRLLGENYRIMFLGDGASGELILNLVDPPFNLPLTGKMPIEASTNLPEEVVTTVDPMLQQIHLRCTTIPGLDELRIYSLQLVF